MPQDCTVIRLEDFDTTKQEEWVSIWNSQNSSYFTKSGVRPFLLPRASSRLTELACHPLLLLMMAIFDSDGNSLRKYEDLDRTQLYDKLIHRFVERERRKDQSFASKEPQERQREIEQDIERFGAAAIGMFNRKRLYISGKELENDLELFGLTKETKPVKGRPLSAAEDLAASFFFVFESRAVRTAGPSTYVVDSTIEYLHNTFGEFLVADFILRKLIAIVRKPEALADEKAFLHVQWYASLMYTPLHTRNVILEMLAEWGAHKMKAEQLNPQLQSGLDAILVDQITKLVSGNEVPLRLISCNRSNEASPLIGLLATYSLNLILLRLALSPAGFEFEEARFATPEGLRAWDIMANLWCAWLPKPDLLGLPSQLEAKRSESTVLITRRVESYYALEDNWLDALRRLSSTLADESMDRLVRALIDTGRYAWH